MRKMTTLAAGFAAALAVAPAAQAAGPVEQSLTLRAWQSADQARTWQGKDWRVSAIRCQLPVRGLPAWRTKLFRQQCGTSVATQTLQSGVAYEIRVSGLFTHWRDRAKMNCGEPLKTDDDDLNIPYHASSDAQWTFASQVPLPQRVCGTLVHRPRVGSAFKLNVTGEARGWQHPWPGQVRKIADDHAYVIKLTGEGKPVHFGIVDHWTVDNAGSVRIQVARADQPPPQ